MPPSTCSEQKSKASTSDAAPLSQILHDRDNPPNSELPTISSGPPLERISDAENAALDQTGTNDGEVKYNVCGNVKSEDEPPDSCVSPQSPKRDSHSAKVLHEHSPNLRPSDCEFHEKCNRLESSECGEEQQSPSKSETEVLSMKPPARPPLSEVLVEPSLVTFKSGFNPFAKLDNSQPSYSIITHSPGPSVGLSTSRKTGLSLKIRKRKFVMSPSKPRQEKPAKQVMNAGKFDENKLSATPPLFATPSSSRKSTSSPLPSLTSPSLFSPGDRDLLQQYSTVKATPCRRFVTTYGVVLPLVYLYAGFHWQI